MADDRSLIAALTEALTPHLRRLVREEVARAELQWRWRTAEQAGELCAKGPHLTKPYDHALVEAEIRKLLAARPKLDTV